MKILGIYLRVRLAIALFVLAVLLLANLPKILEVPMLRTILLLIALGFPLGVWFVRWNSHRT